MHTPLEKSQRDARGSDKLIIKNNWGPSRPLKVMWSPCGEETDDKVEEGFWDTPFSFSHIAWENQYPSCCFWKETSACWPVNQRSYPGKAWIFSTAPAVSVPWRVDNWGSLVYFCKHRSTNYSIRDDSPPNRLGTSYGLGIIPFSKDPSPAELVNMPKQTWTQWNIHETS